MDDERERGTCLDGLLSKIPTLDSCCILFGLRLASIIIGCVGVVVSVLFFLVDVIALAIEDSGIIYEKKTVHSLNTAICFDIVFESGLFIMSIYLVLGAKKRIRSYVRAWIYTNLLLIFGKLSCAIVFVVIRGVWFFILNLIYSGFQIFYLIVVNSYYQNMDTGGRHY